MMKEEITNANTALQPEELLKGVSPRQRVYKLVLTGGPCGGKTTGQARLATFFENLGWKVFRVPEAATVIMSGGIAFGELNDEQVMDFQENLVRTMLALENTYFSMASKSGRNCLVICDRGSMDAAAFIDRVKWEKLLAKLQLDELNICEGRYDHVVHMVSAACGAEDFYSTEGHSARFEGLELARERDQNAVNAWKMHPYVDIVDNRSDFDSKVKHLVDIVVRRLGLDVGDQFKADSRKMKFVVRGVPADSLFPAFTDFDVVHHYLMTGSQGVQSRLRRRGPASSSWSASSSSSSSGRWSYSVTVRRPERKGQVVEVRTPLSRRDYETLFLDHADTRHFPVHKTRRCFTYNNQQYRLDIYRDPCHPRCKGLVLLETFTTLSLEELMKTLPDFLDVTRNVTGDPAFSMFNLALRSDWLSTDTHFCYRLKEESDDLEADDEADLDEDDDAVRMAHMRCAARHGSLAAHRVITPPAIMATNARSALPDLPVDNDDGEDFPRGIDLAGTSDYSSGSEHEA